jgi:alanyl-tRNA synthetase
MDTRTVRNKFFTFFEEREHARVPSSSLVPNDPTLLLTNAGMNQFKPYFRGEQTPPYLRAVSCQKCMRAGGKHNDIEMVGRTARHLTFFEMLGNFSFGEYYKEKACPWAWELITETYGLDTEKLWITIFDTDDEAFEIWRDVVGVRPERIIRMGKKDNFWSMGVAGPCGPCSEIAYDMGDTFGEASEDGPADNEDRYLEIWNLVFMENDCNAQIEPIAELPKKNIDTGLGLERLAMVLQGTSTVFETDLFSVMIDKAEQLTGTRYGADDRKDVSLRILGDHGRSVAFMLADGVLPSNEDRGYVLRLIMRRTIRHARLLGTDNAVLGGLIERVTELMGDDYPELIDKRDLALEVADREESRFDETLKQGMALLEQEIARTKTTSSVALPGEIAFKLHDTFGFPIDITNEIVADAGLSIDRETFERLMAEQRERARAARRSDEVGVAAGAAVAVLEEHGATDFLGYEHLHTEAQVLAILEGEASQPQATAGQEVEMIFDRTVFYAESGGQVGDHGGLAGPMGRGEITDTQRIVPGLIAHRVRILDGDIRVGDVISLEVDSRWRRGAERAHTATHIVHWILRDVLGDHVRQAGSLVEPGRLRFDFTHFDALNDDQLAGISSELQDRVLVDDHVRAYETSFDYAKSIGALAFFGEKYGDFVRVVEVGEYSKELCGGTHVPHTSQIGVAVLTGEGSVAANTRRIEALVGREGLSHLERRAALLERAADLLKANPDEVTEKIERLLVTQKEMERRLEEVDRRSSESDASSLVESAADVDGTRLVVARRDVGVDALRSLAQTLRSKLGSAVIVLGTAGEGRANLVGAVTKDLAERGISARDLLAPGAALLGGGAGGKPELAISGGPSADRIEEAIEAVANAARRALQG